ncbi:MAG: (d)CMP kinase [Alphaproteobacteria bacterium]|nr:(d)CMP kinase [Alphaproteobacteria bacterium]
MIIAVDGTAASGKGTLAKRLASALNLAHLDTGALYRAVAVSALDAGFTASDISAQAAENIAQNLDLSLTESARIRTPEAGEMASVVAAVPEVRSALLNLQRQFATTPPEGRDGAILDGRDIATVVLPEAEVKFFVDARAEIRAERRHKELINAGHEVMLRDILTSLKERDHRDQNRDHAPLKPAQDSIMVDTSDVDVDGMVAFALSHIEGSRTGG